MYIDLEDILEYKQHIVKGYKQVFIRRKNYKIHRLVAAVFLVNPDNKPLVCHKDSNPLNNDVSNLYWGTVKDNVRDCKKLGRHFSQKSAHFKVTEEVFRNMVFDKMFEAKTYDEIAEKYKLSRATVSRVLTWTTYHKFGKRRVPKKFIYQKQYILDNRDKIKEEYKSGTSQMDLTKKYKLGKNTIWRICNNQSYQK